MPTSVPLQPTITAAGLAAIFNAQNTGVEFALTHIAFGTGQYVPVGNETALQAEKVRVPIAGGGRISPTQIQIYAVAMAALGNPFFVGEVGFFGDDGATLLAVYSSTATPSLFLSDTVSTSVSYALGLAALPANSVSVTIDPSASAALLLIGNHVTAPDPHPQYVEKVNGVAFYDPTLTFNQGAEIIGDDLLVYQSAQANNIGNTPSSSPTWWVPLYNYGDTPVAGLTNANVTLSSTQAARGHITFSGALTAALNIVFPNWVKDWTVVNKTTGAFSLTCKTAAGTGVAIPQNGSPTKIRGDGTNIVQAAENIASATQNQHAVQLGQIGSVSGNGIKLNGVNSPNLQFNGSGEFGSAGWTLNSFAAEVDTVSGVGSYFTNPGALAAFTGTQIGQQVPVGPSVVMSMAIDVANFATAGTVSLSLAAYNSSGTFIGNLEFLALTNGTALARYPLSGTTPAGTAYVEPVVTLTGLTAPAFGIVFRRVKTEVGSPSLYSQEADFSALGVGPNPAPVFAAPATQSNQAVNLGQFGSSLGASGYQKFPGGDILQFGAVSASGGSASVTFPIAFPNGVKAIVLTESGASAWSVNNVTNYGVSSSSASGFTAKYFSSNGSAWAVGTSGNFNWVAIGY